MNYWEHVKRGILVVTIIIVTLAYLEAGVRLLGKTAFPLLRTDPEVGTIHVKNFAGYAWDVQSERKNYIRTNSLGYVGKDVPVQKSDSEIRIAVLGDSVVAGLQVDSDKNFTKLLEDKLNASPACGARRFTVMNFGVGSAGTFLEYQIYKKRVAQFHPDYTYVVFHDDFGDNLAKSNFDLERYAEERRAVGIKAFLLQFQLPKLIFSKLKNNELVVGALRSVGLFEAVDIGAMPGTDTDPSSAQDDERYFGYTFYLFDKLSALVSESGSHLITVIFPQEEEYEVPEHVKDNPKTDKLIAYFSGAGISYLDPRKGFASARGGGDSCLTFRCEDHMNESGHRVFADILYADIIDRLNRSGVLCQP